ncbi:hypothetical protein QYF61_003517 [Mycteria americana]|uniref:Uncharacterized protein n=1 Tax=Mycteria americana TaxID=33587 RepID=A0AAN7NU55_MYCAM|nr:hypothetical protein QYF61_003517 [Mycteria americana]
MARPGPAARHPAAGHPPDGTARHGTARHGTAQQPDTRPAVRYGTARQPDTRPGPALTSAPRRAAPVARQRRSPTGPHHSRLGRGERALGRPAALGGADSGRGGRDPLRDGLSSWRETLAKDGQSQEGKKARRERDEVKGAKSHTGEHTDSLVTSGVRGMKETACD